ncbi:hypothetical protein [Companilactobacillus jidongensis]|uniref:hypothetical protein n=1 Tax=Companilactobacillus jidongensis TaxID=2486006 RepID=UPI000F76D4AA|nr:hypothetical protein [Companilactobacillus jidongensis]
MNDLQRVANLIVKMPIGIKYRLISGEYKKIKIDKDSYQDVTADLVSYESAKTLIQKSIDEIDTSDSISDSVVSDKIDSLTTELTTQTAAS